MSFRSAQFEVPILGTPIWVYWDSVCIMKPYYISELIFICVSLENLFISQHQALAEVVDMSETAKKTYVGLITIS